MVTAPRLVFLEANSVLAGNTTGWCIVTSSIATLQLCLVAVLDESSMFCTARADLDRERSVVDVHPRRIDCVDFMALDRLAEILELFEKTHRNLLKVEAVEQSRKHDPNVEVSDVPPCAHSSSWQLLERLCKFVENIPAPNDQ